MTDFEKLKALFDEFGIWQVESEEEKYKAITLNTKETKVVGYKCFFAEFKFDTDGKFIEVGIWE